MIDETNTNEAWLWLYEALGRVAVCRKVKPKVDGGFTPPVDIIRHPGKMAQMKVPPGSYVEDFAEAIDGPEMETENEAYRRGYIDACRAALRIMNNWASSVVYSPRPMVTTWQVASALGLSVAAEKTDAEIATICGVGSRACISKGRLAFQRANGIQSLPFQKNSKPRKSKRP